MALAWGRGERLFPLPALSSRPLVLALPGFGVATKDAYAWLASERGTYRPRSAVLRPSDVDTWAAIAACGVNEFEAVVVRRHPEIARLLEALRAAGAITALMSGSGSAVFGVFDETDRAEAAAQALRAGDDACRVLVTRSAERVERVVNA